MCCMLIDIRTCTVRCVYIAKHTFDSHAAKVKSTQKIVVRVVDVRQRFSCCCKHIGSGTRVHRTPALTAVALAFKRLLSHRATMLRGCAGVVYAVSACFCVVVSAKRGCTGAECWLSHVHTRAFFHSSEGRPATNLSPAS